MNYRNKKWLHDMYWKREMCLIEIARICNCNRSTIINWMNKFNILRRNKTEANIVWHKAKPGIFAGEKNPNWKGGTNPIAPRNRARRKWEKHNKRKIPKGFDVHHIDSNFRNNNLSNLILLSRGDHNRLHRIRLQLMPHVEGFE